MNRLHDSPILAVSVLLAIIALLSEPSHSAMRVDESELHVRTGLIHNSYSNSDNSISSDYTSATAFDVEYEVYTAGQSSWLGRTIIGYDYGSSRMRYLYVGFGKRFYFLSPGMAVDAADGATAIQIVPLLRYYFALCGGIAQVDVQRGGLLYSVSSSVLDATGQVGTIYQLNRGIGIELAAEYGRSFGISTPTVGGNTMRFLLGASYFF